MKFVGKVAMPIAFLCGAFFLGACDNGGNAVLAEGSKENPSDVDKPKQESSLNSVSTYLTIINPHQQRSPEAPHSDQKMAYHFRP